MQSLAEITALDGLLIAAEPDRAPALRIDITSGVATGPTELAAFDAALIAAGIANFNLLVLSSVIPAGSDVVVSDRAVKPSGNWGDRLYVVMAQQRSSVPGAEAWAGIGWVQEADNGRGLFVEHEGNSRVGVERDIRESLSAMCESREQRFGPIHMSVAGVRCAGQPACALVVATYRSASW
jgi:arginine decarboxylase